MDSNDLPALQGDKIRSIAERYLSRIHQELSNCPSKEEWLSRKLRPEELEEAIYVRALLAGAYANEEWVLKEIAKTRKQLIEEFDELLSDRMVSSAVERVEGMKTKSFTTRHGKVKVRKLPTTMRVENMVTALKACAKDHPECVDISVTIKNMTERQLRDFRDCIEQGFLNLSESQIEETSKVKLRPALDLLKSQGVIVDGLAPIDDRYKIYLEDANGSRDVGTAEVGDDQVHPQASEAPPIEAHEAHGGSVGVGEGGAAGGGNPSESFISDELAEALSERDRES